MNELVSLVPILAYALTIAVLALLLRRLAEWNDGPSLASLIGARQDLLWPRGVQEEEPVRWHVEALRPWRDQRMTDVTRTAPDRPRSQVPVPHPCEAARRAA